MRRSRYRNLLLFLLLGTLFGVAFVSIKAGLAQLPPVLFASLRFGVAAPLLLAFIILRYDTWLPQSRDDYVGVGVGAVLVVAGTNGFLFFGQQGVTSAAASVVFALNPVLAPVFAVFLIDERLDLVDASGIAIGLCGVVVLVDPSQTAFLAGSALSILLVLCGAASNALGSVLLKQVDPTMKRIPLTTWAMVVGAPVLYGTSLAVGETTAGVTVSRELIFAILMLGIPSTALAYPIYFTLIGRIGPVRTNLMSYVVPVVAAAVGWVWLGEQATATTVTGFVVIVSGVVLLERSIVLAELRSVYRVTSG